jgi:ribosomal protein S18 acetylase RimI-like enzyme
MRMSIRPLALPQDLVSAADAVAKAFQYPGHPEWELDTAEQEQFADAIRRIRRAWPAMRLFQCVSPAMRDFMRGFVWEEGGVFRGFVVAQRDGQTPVWQIEPLGVLPEFRRRGIARRLMTEALAMMRSRGATGVRLGVIDGNTPAQTLYRSLGFVDYGGTALYERAPSGACQQPTLPSGYEELRLARFDWRARYEMDQRIVPAGVQKFEAIVPGRYRTPLLMRALAPLFRTSVDQDILVRRARDRVAVGRAGWSIAKSGKGKSSIRVRLDPAHADLAPYLVQRALCEVLSRRPHLPVHLFLPAWMPEVGGQAEAVGFVRKRTHKAMGMKL